MPPFFAPLLEPLGFLGLLMALAVGWLLYRRKWQPALWLALPTALLWLLGSTPLAETLVERTERAYATNLVTSVPTADVVIALGGGHTTSRLDPLGFSNNEAGDRVLAAIELVRRGKARTLVLGGTALPPRPPERPALALVQDWITRWQLVPGAVTNLGVCANTHDEALRCRQLCQELGWKRVILVTSALHLPRSAAVFRKAGVDVIPVPADFQVAGIPQPPGSFSPFPRQHRFELLSLYIHEQVGFLVYRLRGWI
jgi:uncharacterized SAM-binding protein YcdF (DUF218 family)